MWTTLMGIFFVLHGLVHLLYAGQALRFFELRPGMTWPDGSWAFSKLLGNETTRMLATILLALAALGFLVGGLGLFIRQDWWRLVTLAAVVISSLIFIFFWDGRFQAMADQGGVGLLINLAILVLVLFLKWPI
jgi:hypothetical protein